MVIVYDKHGIWSQSRTGKNTEKLWRFRADNAKAGEGLAESAIREVYEETGLRLNSIQACGLIHWECAN